MKIEIDAFVPPADRAAAPSSSADPDALFRARHRNERLPAPLSAAGLAEYNAPFQTKEDLQRYLSADTIVCLVCGKHCRALNTHLRVHGITAVEYRREFGIPATCGLASPASRALYKAAVTPEKIESLRLEIKRVHERWAAQGDNRKMRVLSELCKISRDGKASTRNVVVELACPKCGRTFPTKLFHPNQKFTCFDCATRKCKRKRLAHYAERALRKSQPLPDAA